MGRDQALLANKAPPSSTNAHEQNDGAPNPGRLRHSAGWDLAQGAMMESSPSMVMPPSLAAILLPSMSSIFSIFYSGCGGGDAKGRTGLNGLPPFCL